MYFSAVLRNVGKWLTGRVGDPAVKRGTVSGKQSGPPGRDYQILHSRGSWDLAPWIVCSPSMHEALGSVPRAREMKANRSQGQPGLREALPQKRKKKKVKHHLYRLMRPPKIPIDKAPRTPPLGPKDHPIHRGMQPCPHKTPLSETPKHQHSPCPTSCR